MDEGKLQAVLVRGFNREGFSEMLKFDQTLNLEFGKITSNLPFESQVAEVISRLKKQDKLLDLLIAAKVANPDNREIAAFLRKSLTVKTETGNDTPPEGDEEVDQQARDRLTRVEYAISGLDGTNGLQSRVKKVEEKIGPIESQLREIDRNSKRNSASLDSLAAQMKKVLDGFEEIKLRMNTTTVIQQPQAPAQAKEQAVKVELTQTMIWFIIFGIFALLGSLTYAQLFLANGGS